MIARLNSTIASRRPISRKRCGNRAGSGSNPTQTRLLARSICAASRSANATLPSLESDCMTFDAGITAAHHDAGLRIARNDLGRAVPPRNRFDLVPTPGQRLVQLGTERLLKPQLKRLADAGRIGSRPDGPARHFGRLLHVQLAVDQTTDHRQVPLRLPISTGSAADQHGGAVEPLDREAVE